MARSLIVRPEAEEDIREAYEWYESRRGHLGHEFLEEIELLEERPKMFPKVYDNLRRGFPYRFPYAVYFLVEGTTIVIKGVLHQRRNPAEWLKRYTQGHYLSSSLQFIAAHLQEEDPEDTEARDRNSPLANGRIA